MIKLEIKKLLYKNRLLLFIAIFFIFNALQIMVYVNNTSISDYPYYRFYLNQYADCYQSCTEDIEKLNYQYTHLSSLEAENQQQYLAGGITKEEYLECFEYLQNLKKSSNGFHIFYEQYMSAKVNNTSLIDTYYWDAFVNLEGIDYLLILLIIISSVLIFNVDKNSKFSDLQKASISYINLFRAKCIIVYIITTVVFVLFKVQKVFLLSICYSHVGWNAPMNSVASLNNSNGELSLWQFTIYLFLIQYVGITSFGALCAFLSLVIKKAEIAFFFENALVFLPMIILKDQVVYSTPILGPMAALKYFYGSIEIDYGEYIEHRFNEFNYRQVLIIILISILLQIFFVCLSRRIYQWQQKEH